MQREARAFLGIGRLHEIRDRRVAASARRSEKIERVSTSTTASDMSSRATS